MKINDFYDVVSDRVRTIPSDCIRATKLKNGQAALIGWDAKRENLLYKFIKDKDFKKREEKFGFIKGYKRFRGGWACTK